MAFFDLSKAIYRKQCNTRNVGQCPTSWPPCRI